MDEEADRTGPSVTAFVKAAEFFETNGRYQEAIDEPSIRNYIACATGAADGYLKLNDPRGDPAGGSAVAAGARLEAREPSRLADTDRATGRNL